MIGGPTYRCCSKIKPFMKIGLYLFSAILLISLAYFVFRVIVRRDYREKRRLSPLSSLLELLVWGLLIGFPYLYNPEDWPYFWLFSSTMIQIIGLAAIILGMSLAFGVMLWFGLRRAMGLEVNQLINHGPYRLSRNPQILGGFIMIFGVALQWLSLYSLGWIIIYAAIAHLMVITEEEHLTRIFGEAYLQYCEDVPRYLGYPRKKVVDGSKNS
jgi:protein-S-isoprenylcysteine O-methyltransferase Ste14